MIPEDVYTSRSGASACEEWVVSLLAIHNDAGADGRAGALSGAARVLKTHFFLFTSALH